MNINARAMLCSLSLRAWRGTMMDDALSKVTEKAVKAESGTMKVIKSLMPQHMLDPITHIMNVARQEHYRFTVPGLFRGQHLLCTKAFDDYIYIQRGLKEHYWEAVNNVISIYPDVVEAAPKRLHDAYRESDFPSVEKLKTFFAYDLQFCPIPDLKDWRMEGMVDADTELLKNEIEDDIRLMYRRATRDVFERAKEILTGIATQAKEYEQKFGESRLRDATIQNLKDMSALVVKMNVTGDKELEKLGYEMLEAFADVDGPLLRSNQSARDKIAAAAERLLKGIPA